MCRQAKNGKRLHQQVRVEITAHSVAAECERGGVLASSEYASERNQQASVNSALGSGVIRRRQLIGLAKVTDKTIIAVHYQHTILPTEYYHVSGAQGPLMLPTVWDLQYQAHHSADSGDRGVNLSTWCALINPAV